MHDCLHNLLLLLMLMLLLLSNVMLATSLEEELGDL